MLPFYMYLCLSLYMYLYLFLCLLLSGLSLRFSLPLCLCLSLSLSKRKGSCAGTMHQVAACCRDPWKQKERAHGSTCALLQSTCLQCTFKQNVENMYNLGRLTSSKPLISMASYDATLSTSVTEPIIILHFDLWIALTFIFHPYLVSQLYFLFQNCRPKGCLSTGRRNYLFWGFNQGGLHEKRLQKAKQQFFIRTCCFALHKWRKMNDVHLALRPPQILY